MLVFGFTRAAGLRTVIGDSVRVFNLELTKVSHDHQGERQMHEKQNVRGDSDRDVEAVPCNRMGWTIIEYLV